MTLDDIRAARPRVARWIRPTPLMRHPVLDARAGVELWIKHENHNPTGAFKVRGGLNLVGAMPGDERRRGVVTASTGNHGQSIALACREHGVPCVVFVPEGNNPEKNASMRAMGAEVFEYGRDYDAARERVEQVVAREGWRYVHSANEPHLLAGVGTYAHEIFERVDDLDYLFVPIGGGSGAAATCIVRTGMAMRAKVIGVQATGADAFTRSWRGPDRVTADRVNTIAEGVATRVTFDLTFSILKQQLDDIVTLEDADIEDAVRAAVTLTHNLAEPSGAAALAAARNYRPAGGKKVACVITGGNIDTRTLRRLLG